MSTSHEIFEHACGRELQPGELGCKIDEMRLKLLCKLEEAHDCPPFITVGFKNLKKETREQYIRSIERCLSVLDKLEKTTNGPFYAFHPGPTSCMSRGSELHSCCGRRVCTCLQ